MSQSKTKPSKKPKQAEPLPLLEDGGPEGELGEATPTQISSESAAFLGRAYAFLFNIPRYAIRAKRHGYTQKEHELGWSLWSTASGKHRPFEHWLAERDQAETGVDMSAERYRLLQEIDAFENLWFPRMRALIARVVPRDNVARFGAAFFKDLSQQPLGPAVVDSVKTFLKRVEELKGSAEPGARELYKTLGERGLTAKKVEQMRALLAAAEEHKTRSGQPPSVSAAEIARAKEEQLAALESLKLWYNDWATTFRGVFDVRTQIALALTAPKRRRPDGGADDEAEEPVAGAP